MVQGGEGKGNCAIDELTQRDIKGKEEQNRSRGDLPVGLVWLLKYGKDSGGDSNHNVREWELVNNVSNYLR